MSEQDLFDWLKENLTITISTDRGYYEGDPTRISVRLLLKNPANGKNEEVCNDCSSV